MRAQTIEDLDPDGVVILVDWDDMQVGDSLFVPCINTKEARRQVQAVFWRRQWTARLRIGIENHIWGLRIWRIA